MQMLDINLLNIPSDQKSFLHKLLFKAANNQKAMFAVNLIINIIHTVETIYKGKGTEILKGAHIVIDSPELLEMLKENTLTRDRFSSHYRNAKISEFGVHIPSNADFLVGLAKSINNEKPKLWMQLENTKVDFNQGLIRGIILAISHLLDYLRYQLSGKNIGPCGLSEHVESNPIKIQNVQSLLNEIKIDIENESQNTDKRSTVLQSRQNIISARAV